MKYIVNVVTVNCWSISCAARCFTVKTELAALRLCRVLQNGTTLLLFLSACEQQFKKRFFMLKQQSDYTYILEMYKDDRKSDAKGAIFLDLAQEVVRVSSHDDAP